MKILALHLPQFHRIPENDEWWGEGFTEWDNVRRARPLYEGHQQPRVPLGGDYYDLSDPATIIKQHKLAAEYGVDGFIYYHYWFNGKMLLEKPVDMLLKLPEADREFCLCWANEPWTRAWDGKSNCILMEQTFGGQEDWQAHIDYLIPFFKDPRYIRIEEHPVFFVYSPNRIPSFDEMVRYWNVELEKANLPSLYVVEFLSSFNPSPSSQESTAVMEFEPLFSAHYEVSNFVKGKRFLHKRLGMTDIVDYDYLWERLLRRKGQYAGKRIIKGAFTNFDNSPRKGVRGFITKGATPEKFRSYLKRLAETPREGAEDVIVINAWNEWGEGAVLEPDEMNGYAWLEAVRDARAGSDGTIGSGHLDGKGNVSS